MIMKATSCGRERIIRRRAGGHGDGDWRGSALSFSGWHRSTEEATLNRDGILRFEDEEDDWADDEDDDEEEDLEDEEDDEFEDEEEEEDYDDEEDDDEDDDEDDEDEEEEDEDDE
jgi:hypothetical protein